MTPERWQQVKELFNSALEREPGHRPAFLDEACRGDEHLRGEVESLLSSHEREGNFIDSPALELAADLITGSQSTMAAGKILGSYRILSILGRGGMGEVYLAEDTRLGRKIALKFLPSSLAADQDRLRRFEREARAASALNHPNILTIYEIGSADGRQFIATEYIDGETMRQRMIHSRLSVSEVLDVAMQVGSALAAAHQAGIVHRDIKPENIMLRRDGYVKVVDFGLAKPTETANVALDTSEPTALQIDTGTGTVIGTTAYMSPEQARGLPVDARTDIWSLGVVMYEMLATRPPFEGVTRSDVLVAILDREPESLVDVSDAVPESLEWIVAKALTKEKDDRYQTAREFLSDLRRLKQKLDLEAATKGSRRLKQSLPLEPDLSGDLRHAPPREPVSSKDRQSAGVTAEDVSETRSISSPTRLTNGNAAPLRNRWLPAVIALVVLVALVVVYLLLARPKSDTELVANRTEVLRTTQITTKTGLEVPALSPDGNSIAYSSRLENANVEIYVKPLTPGAREIQLTSDGQGNSDPAWSPDGKLMAFRSQKRGGIWVIPATGGTARQLTDFGASPAWSSDGSLIAFQSEGSNMPPTTIWTVSSQGGDPTQITQAGTPAGGHSLPAWSPDGKRIVFVAYTGAGVMEIWTIAAKGGDPVQIIRRRAGFVSPVYSPSGEYIYSGSVTETSNFVLCQLRISPTTGTAIGEPVILADTGLARVQGRLTISADGKKLAYSTRTQIGDLMSVPIAPDSGEPVGPSSPLTQSTSYRKSLPSFSPDGRKIAFVQFRGGENQKIWMMDRDGSNISQLTTGGSLDWAPSWFPDNDTIAFLSHEEGQPNQRIWSVSVGTGRKKFLLDPGQEIGWPRLSPDGKQFAFNSTKSGTINVWTASLGGGAPRQLTFDTEQMGWPCWSPDGKLLLLSIKRGAGSYLGTMPAAGGEVTQLALDSGERRPDGSEFLGNLRQPYDWSPDGDKILFAGEREGVWNVYWYSLSKKQQQQLTQHTSRTHYVRYPSWSPLGNQIVYEYSDTTGNIWLMELK